MNAPDLLRSATEGTPDFDAQLSRLKKRGESDLARVEPSVREIITAVQTGGDHALRAQIERFEKRSPKELLIRDYGGRAALESLTPPVCEALELSAMRVRRYHEKQREGLLGFEYEENGIRLGSRSQPVERAGVYVPGGKARYPSSVLMAAIPAAVAGVKEIIVACPDTCPEVRAACHLAGVHALLDAGGAQAIAALAYGTESVPKVDKIVGPGNIYVAAAKRLVFGEVSIDSIAGPSEILVVADDTANAAVVAADLLSQAEHDEAAYPLLVTTSAALVEDVRAELGRQLATQPRRVIAEASLRNNGLALVVSSVGRLADVANALAAEHVAVQTRDARAVAATIRAAGAIFIGSSTPEAAGDYVAGPSHVLPTGGAARHASPLGVYDFISRTSIIEYTEQALAAQGAAIAAFARVEGLEAHARAVEVRTAGPSARR
ncbi:MAG TPA: histidinol dehydrogenase [Polyangiaceae bacterium]|nr:histidinol dehydrogenase [Polyangiaceae bacterium]